MTDNYQKMLSAVRPSAPEDYTALIRKKNADLDQLFAEAAGLIAKPCEISAPENDGIRAQLAALQQKEAALNNALSSLTAAYEKLKAYEADLRRREALISDGFKVIESMGSDLSRLDQDLARWAQNFGNEGKEAE